MTDQSIDQQAESLVATTAGRLLAVRADECLYCYVTRMLDEHGCDNTLRFARRYRDQCAPSATRLDQALQAMGGYCDCEIFANAVTVARAFRPEDDETGDWLEPETMPDCRGAERGSTKACVVWESQAGGGW